MERTLLILKPDAVAAHRTGEILKMVIEAGFEVKAMKMTQLNADQAGRFYGVHRGKPFFEPLLAYMTSGKIVPVALERENAVTKLREILGATDPKKADPGTIRALYGTDIEHNACHGSDSVENGRIETYFFFGEMEF
jgi:nucleoside-diphosphate kinase